MIKIWVSEFASSVFSMTLYSPAQITPVWDHLCNYHALSAFELVVVAFDFHADLFFEALEIHFSFAQLGMMLAYRGPAIRETGAPQHKATTN
jgi:hypothetical protein